MRLVEGRAVWSRAALVTVILKAGLLVVPLPAGAQQTGKVAHIGYLSSHAPERFRIEVFRAALREFGWSEGQNLIIDYRSAQGKMDQLPHLAEELARRKVDVIVAVTTVSALAAKRATPTIPIVFKYVSDPLGSGLVPSLAQPGGNITGFTHRNAGLAPKRLELLRQLLPGVEGLAVLWHPGGLGERTQQEMLKETEDAARALQVPLQFHTVRGREHLAEAFADIARNRTRALIILPSPLFLDEHRRLVALAAENRLPAIYFTREFVEVGGLMAYGANIDEMIRGAARQVDRVLKGASPATLPVEQSTRFELVLNIKAAQALGLAIPPALLARADEVIE